MMGSYTDGFLRRLRNEIDIDLVIQRLRVETRDSQKILRPTWPDVLIAGATSIPLIWSWRLPHAASCKPLSF
jgi:hypothetical protein